MLTITLLLVILNQLDSYFSRKGLKKMGDDLDAKLTALDAALNAVAARMTEKMNRIQELVAAGNPPTKAQLDHLQSDIDALATLGKDDSGIATSPNEKADEPTV